MCGLTEPFGDRAFALVGTAVTPASVVTRIALLTVGFTVFLESFDGDGDDDGAGTGLGVLGEKDRGDDVEGADDEPLAVGSSR